VTGARHVAQPQQELVVNDRTRVFAALLASIASLVGCKELEPPAGAGVAYQLAILAPPPATAGILQPLATQPSVQVQDVYGAPVAVGGVVVTATASAPGIANSNTTATTNGAGIATFSGLALGGPPGPTTLSFSASTLTGVTTPHSTTLSWTRTIGATVVPGFVLTGGIPNAAYLAGEARIVLVYSTATGHVEATSADGTTFSGTGATTTKFNVVMAPLGLSAADILVRARATGIRRYFMKGLRVPADARPIEVYAADQGFGGTGSLTLVSTSPVYQGTPLDSADIGVMDIIETRLPGEWRMVYVARRGVPGNTRSATSGNDGATWTFETNNLFGDLGLPNNASHQNVDPAPLRLADGSYVAVTMRAASLSLWNSWDGRTYEQQSGSIAPSFFGSVVPGGTGLFDPTLVQLPSGKIYMYVTLGTPSGDRIVAAEITVTP
jgi:hypothetical protein